MDQTLIDVDWSDHKPKDKPARKSRSSVCDDCGHKYERIYAGSRRCGPCQLIHDIAEAEERSALRRRPWETDPVHVAALRAAAAKEEARQQRIREVVDRVYSGVDPETAWVRVKTCHFDDRSLT